MDNENHYHLVRADVKGIGNLQLTLYSFDDVYSFNLRPIVMTSLAARTQDALANFRGQGARLKFQVTEIDESFQISEIRVYLRPIGTSFPLL
jgi:hypothetical protein